MTVFPPSFCFKPVENVRIMREPSLISSTFVLIPDEPRGSSKCCLISKRLENTSGGRGSVRMKGMTWEINILTGWMDGEIK